MEVLLLTGNWPEVRANLLVPPPSPGWRNWQTQRTQNAPPAFSQSLVPQVFPTACEKFPVRIRAVLCSPVRIDESQISHSALRWGMPDILMSLTFDSGGTAPRTSTRTLSVPSPEPATGEQLLAEQLFGELEKELAASDFHTLLPDCGDLLNIGTQPTPMTEWVQQYNTREVWHEISNTLLEARYLLAQARAYKEIEDRRTVEHDILSLHLMKIDAFDRAVYLLAKIEDLLVLLLFVNLEFSLVNVDLSRSDWAKQITWDRVKDGLKRRRGSAAAKRGILARFLGCFRPSRPTNPVVDALNDSEYDAIRSILARFKSPHFVRQTTEYRDRSTHRIHPSVDHPGFTPVLAIPRRTATGTVITGIPARPREADFAFLDLYQSAVQTFGHCVVLLRELKAIPRFG